MNKQKNGKSRGIEWTDFTWNPVGGCQHGCRWEMPDGTTAICYAETIADRMKSPKFYPNGFEHHYWHPDRLNEPLKQKQPSRIFLDSMSDLMGAWVSADEIMQVLSVVREAHWHSFQLLTKNAPRLLEFKDEISSLPNLWVGVSAPPSQMFGKPLTHNQQERMVHRQMKVLSEFPNNITWMSIEPLSFDIAPLIAEYNHALNWAVIGAATNGNRIFQPEPEWVSGLLSLFDKQGVHVFFKGNLKWQTDQWREDFPNLAV